jgi:prepilin-type N-terminal cleavage/methylation domain-containing protein
MLTQRTSHKHIGFTIVELLVVIVVLGILVSLSYFAFNSWRGRVAETELKSDPNELGNPSRYTKNLTKEAISEFIPGYLWRNLSTKQHLEGAWSCATSFRVSKLPSIAAIKRKPL